MIPSKEVPCLGFEISKEQAITEVRSSGRSDNYRPNPEIHRHNHHEILIIKKGKGRQLIDFEWVELQDNQVFFLRPGQIHQFLPDPDAEFYFVAIDNHEIQLNSSVKLSQFEFFQSFYSSGHVIMDSVDQLVETAKTLQKELKKTASINQALIISSYTVIFLIQIQQAFLRCVNEQQLESSHSELVAQFNQWLDDPSFNKRFVKDYADVLFVTPNYLNEKVKNETGEPASYWINKQMITEAKRLLMQTDASIKEIASQLDFSTASHFNRFFKTHVGDTATEFRKNS